MLEATVCWDTLTYAKGTLGQLVQIAAAASGFGTIAAQPLQRRSWRHRRQGIEGAGTAVTAFRGSLV